MGILHHIAVGGVSLDLVFTCVLILALSVRVTDLISSFHP